MRGFSFEVRSGVRLALKGRAAQALVRAFGRKAVARLGRFLSMQARLDLPNDRRTNGEALVQRAYLESWHRAGVRAVVIDVGANVGDWSLGLAEQRTPGGPLRGGMVLHMMEPVPASRAALERRLEGFGWAGELEVVAAAVSDEEGEQRFHVYGEAGRRSSLAPIVGEAPREELLVPTITLDGHARSRGFERLSFVKIDTEGFDMAVLRGAVGLLRERRIDALQFEYNQRWIETRTFLRDAFELLAPLGYALGKVTPYGIERYAHWHFELETFREGNYLAWHGTLPEGLAEFPWWHASG